MNTSEKGNVLEDNSLGIIEKLIEEGLFGIKDYVKVFKKKKYPSKIRGAGDVEFDLSIEIWPPNAKRYFSVYFIECKNYRTRIPIEKVKKFYADIIETGGVNVKGIFISATALQKGAYDYATAQGMMVIEGKSENDYEIILHKRNFSNIDIIPRINETLNKKLLDKGILSLESTIDKQILKSFISANSNVSLGIELLSKKDINELAIKELNTLNHMVLRNAYGVDKTVVEKYLAEEYGVKIVLFESDTELGTCNINKKIIGLNKSIIGTPRELFILCHELGHFILHKNLSIRQELLNWFSDTDKNFKNQKVSLENPNQWIEWQANYFSISFSLPASSITARLWNTQQRMGLKKGDLNINDNNDFEYNKIIKNLAYHFNTSQISVLYRLRELKLITNNSRLKKIGEIIENNSESLFV